jgi:hypothetical protein
MEDQSMADCVSCPQHRLTIDVLEQTRREASIQGVRLYVALELLRRLRGWTAPAGDLYASELLADTMKFLALPGCSTNSGDEKS